MNGILISEDLSSAEHQGIEGPFVLVIVDLVSEIEKKPLFKRVSWQRLGRVEVELGVCLAPPACP